MAIETTNEDGAGSNLSINPGTYKTIESGTRGFFIAGSIEEIKRFRFYLFFKNKGLYLRL